MKTITVRNIPDDVYRAVAELARRNRRSMQQQVIVMLERARRLHGTRPTDRAAALRRRFAERDMGDTVEEIRAERRR